MIKLEVGKYYKTRGGDKVLIVDKDEKHFIGYNYTNADVRYYEEYGDCETESTTGTRDIVSEWKEPITGWVNVYVDDDNIAHCSDPFYNRKMADTYAKHGNRIACVPFTEGDGL